MIAQRMKKVREILGWKQNMIATAMKITQQAYSFLEQGHCSPRIDTLSRFCEVMNIELSFLLAFDLPVDEETVEKYGRKNFIDLITEQRILEQKLEFLQHLMRQDKEDETLPKTVPFPIAAAQ